MTTLALVALFAAVQARFAAEAADLGMLATADFAGTSTPSITGTPTAAAEVVVRFDVGGTVGVAGIFYSVSTDSGQTFGTPTALGTGSSIVVLGVTLTLGAGTVVAGDLLSWAASSPSNPVQAFGWREPSNRSASFRVVWVPGDDRSASLGTLVSPRQVSGNPKRLYTLEERATVYIEARDATAPTNDQAQYVAARELFDQWVRAVYKYRPNVVRFGEPTYVGIGGGRNPLAAVSQAGATIRVPIEIDASITDAPSALASTKTAAVVATTVDDVTDTETVSPA